MIPNHILLPCAALDGILAEGDDCLPRPPCAFLKQCDTRLPEYITSANRTSQQQHSTWVRNPSALQVSQPDVCLLSTERVSITARGSKMNRHRLQPCHVQADQGSQCGSDANVVKVFLVQFRRILLTASNVQPNQKATHCERRVDPSRCGYDHRQPTVAEKIIMNPRPKPTRNQKSLILSKPEAA